MPSSHVPLRLPEGHRVCRKVQRSTERVIPRKGPFFRDCRPLLNDPSSGMSGIGTSHRTLGAGSARNGKSNIYFFWQHNCLTSRPSPMAAMIAVSRTASYIPAHGGVRGVRPARGPRGGGLPGATRPVEVLPPIQPRADGLLAVLSYHRARFRLFRAGGPSSNGDPIRPVGGRSPPRLSSTLPPGPISRRWRRAGYGRPRGAGRR